MKKTSLERAKQKEYRYTPATIHDLKFEQGAYGERFRSGSANQQAANVSLSNEQVCRPIVILEVIWFGKIHLVTTDEFVAKAKDYHKILRNETLILYGDLKDNKKIYQEWADPSGFIDSAVAHAVSGFTAASDAVVGWFKTVKRAPKPDLVEFNRLITRVEAVGSKLEACDLTYDSIHGIGLELSVIREDSRRLYKKIELFRNRAIEGAETMTRGLETVESASFQILALVPTITMMDPLREAAYRISLVIVRAGARSAGAAMADMSIAQELCGVLKSDVPPLIVDIVTSPINKYMKGIGVKDLERDFCIFIIKQHVEFLCDLALLVHSRSSKGENVTDEDIKQLGWNRLTSCIAEILSKILGGRPADSNIQKLAKALAESTLNTLWRDYLAASDTAKAQNRSTWDVFLADLPWTIVKIIQGTFVGVMQRQAATIPHEANYAGMTDAEKGFELMKAQKASAIFNGKVNVPKEMVVKNRSPLPAITADEYNIWYLKMGLHPDIAGPLRRYAHDADQYVAFRIPSKAMAILFNEYSMRPKPLWIKAKSAKRGDNYGRVVKPTPSTHDDYEGALDTWQKGLADLRANGGMIREDGLVFHPDMLGDWARAHPEDRNAAQCAHEGLTRMNQFGMYDLSEPATMAYLESQYPGTQATLRKARIGYYSDLDLAEVVDASTGDRIAMGSGNEKELDELAYLQRNRNNLDREINVKDDLKNIPPEFRGPDGKPRVNDQKITPHHQSLIQHGGDYEFYKGSMDDAVAVVGPNGQWRTFNNRAQYESWMEQVFGTKYRKPDIRGLNLKKNSLEDPTNWAEAGGQGERVKTDKLQRMQRYYERAKRDLDGTGNPVTLNEIGASLFHRGLSIEPEAFAALGWNSRVCESAQMKHKTLVAADLDAQNLVIAAAADGSISEALARLARTARDLQLENATTTVWYEIYAANKPVTSDYILNRLGPSHITIPSAVLDVQNLVSSFFAPHGKKIYAYCLDGFVETYSPVLKYAGQSPADPMEQPDLRNRQIRDNLVASFGVNPGEYGQMQGQKLAVVWETIRSRKLSVAGVEISSRQVAVFTAGMVAYPTNVIPRELPGYVRKGRPVLVG